MSNSNEENNSDGGNGLNLGPDILEALLRASQQSDVEPDNLDSMEAISGEYSSINKTIDELNSFLDRWQERHSRLRDEIDEVLTEQQQSQHDSTGDINEQTKNEAHTNPNAANESESSSTKREPSVVSDANNVSDTLTTEKDIPDSNNSGVHAVCERDGVVNNVSDSGQSENSEEKSS